MQWKYKDERIYSVQEKGDLISEVTFINKNTGEIDINHVYVNPELRGKGVASQSMEVMIDY